MRKLQHVIVPLEINRKARKGGSYDVLRRDYRVRPLTGVGFYPPKSLRCKWRVHTVNGKPSASRVGSARGVGGGHLPERGTSYTETTPEVQKRRQKHPWDESTVF